MPTERKLLNAVDLVGEYRATKGEIALMNKFQSNVNCLAVSLGDAEVFAYISGLAEKNHVFVRASDFPDQDVFIPLRNNRRNGMIFLGRTGELFCQLLELEKQRYAAALIAHSSKQ